MAKFLRHEKEIKQEIILETNSHEAVSSDNGHDEDSATAGCDNNASGSQVHVWSRPQHTWNSGGINPFSGYPCGWRIQ